MSSMQLIWTRLDQAGQDWTGTDRTGPSPARCGMERNGKVSFQAKGDAEVQTGFTSGSAEDRNEENWNEP